MLQTIRDHTQGWLAGSIVSILIIMFALWGISAYFTGGAASTTVAKVNGVAISKERFTLSYEQARRQLQSQQGKGAALTSKQEAGLKERVLNELISTEALRQASLAADFYVSSLQVDSYLQSIPEFQVDGHFSLAKFQEVMASSPYSAGELLELIKTTLLIAQPKLGLAMSSLVFPDEAKQMIALVNQERDLSYLNLNASVLTKDNAVPIKAEQIETYYKEHESEFKTPEQVSVDYVELSLNEVLATFTPSPEALKAYYNENINNYTQPGRWKLGFILIPVAEKADAATVSAAEKKAVDILAALRKGAAFETYAKEYTNTSLQTAFSSWVSLNQLDSVFQKPVSILSKAAPLSEPIRSEQDWVILKMLDQQETQIQAFAAVKDKVAETIKRQQAEERLASLRDKLADLSYEHPESLQPVVTQLHLKLQSTGLFTRDKGGADLSANKKVREAAFSSDVLNSQNNSDVIQLNPDSMLVLRIKTHLPSALLPLKTVSKQIQDRLELEQTRTRLEAPANEMNEKLQKGAKEADLSVAYHLNWTPLGFVGRYSDKVATAILDKAFQLPRPNSKASYGVVQVPSGYAVVALHAVRDGVVKDDKQLALFSEQIQNSEGLLEYELYKQGIVQKAKVVIEGQD